MNTTFIRQVGFWKWLLRYGWLVIRRKVLRIDSRITLPTGKVMVLPRTSQSSSEVWVTNGDIDWGSEALFARFADPNRDFLDIGAHVGYYSSYLAPLVRRVYAFEPDERNLGALRTNAALAGNVEVIPQAVSSANGTALLHLGSGSSVSSLEARIGGPTREVTAVAVDSFAASREQLDVCLVKTDVEGHDLDVLKGMRFAAARFQPLVITECSGTPELTALCSDWGYGMYAFARDRRTLRTQLMRMGPVELHDCWYKMLFLVPPRLEHSFEKLASVRGRA